MKILKNQAVLQKNESLRRGHFLLNRKRAIWTIISGVRQYRWRYTGPWIWLEEINHWSLARQISSSPSESPHNKRPHNSLSSCCCSLLVPFIFLRHPDASFSQSKPLSQLPYRHSTQAQVPLLLQGRFVPIFQQCVQERAIGHGSSALHIWSGHIRRNCRMTFRSILLYR